MLLGMVLGQQLFQFWLLFPFSEAAGEEENCRVEHEHDAADIHFLVGDAKRQVSRFPHHRHRQKGLA